MRGRWRARRSCRQCSSLAMATAAHETDDGCVDGTQNYGSKHIDDRAVDIMAVKASSHRRQATLRVPEVAATWCYSVEWSIAAERGREIAGAPSPP